MLFSLHTPGKTLTSFLDDYYISAQSIKKITFVKAKMTFIFIFSPLLLRSNTADAAVCVFITVEWQHKTVHSASSCSSILICIPIIFFIHWHHSRPNVAKALKGYELTVARG